MCNSVIHQGRHYDTSRQLAALLGGCDKLVWEAANPFKRVANGRDWRDLDLCLCAIDLPATLAKADLKWRLGADPMEHFIEG